MCTITDVLETNSGCKCLVWTECLEKIKLSSISQHEMKYVKTKTQTDEFSILYSQIYWDCGVVSIKSRKSCIKNGIEYFFLCIFVCPFIFIRYFLSYVILSDQTSIGIEL